MHAASETFCARIAAYLKADGLTPIVDLLQRIS